MPDQPKPSTDSDRQGNIAPQTGPEMATPARWIEALRLTIDAVSRINVALQGQFLGGLDEARDIASQLQKAFLMLEAPDA